MSFWVQHGLHLALVVIPSSAMGTGLALERRKGRQERHAPSGRPTPAPAPTTTEPSAFVPRAWLTPQPGTSNLRTRTPPVVRSAMVQHPLALPAVAVSAAGAALTHLVVMPEHFKVSILYGTFFLCAAILQISWAVIVTYRPTRGALVAGAVGSAATVLLWLVSRTVGIPVGLGGVDGGAPETVGALDVLATTFELIAVVGVVVALRDTSLCGRSPSQWPPTAKMMAVVALCGTAALAFWAPVN